MTFKTREERGMKDNKNLYYKARMEAAALDPIFSNRTRAADQVYASTEALADYEHPKHPTIPPCDVVQRMIEVYGTHWLKGEHVRAYCPLMTECAGESSELARAALGWVAHLTTTEGFAREFATMALDGHIDDAEVEKAKAIRGKAVDLARVMHDTIAAIGKNDFDSHFKVNIKPDSVNILQDGEKIAYFQGNKLHAFEAEVAQTLNMGSWTWEVESDGGLSLYKV